MARGKILAIVAQRVMRRRLLLPLPSRIIHMWRFVSIFTVTVESRSSRSGIRAWPASGGATLPFGLTDADVFVGLSAGSVLASVLAAGIAPDEVLRIVIGTSKIYEQFRASEYMAPNLGSLPARFRSMLRTEEALFTNWLSGATDPNAVARFGLKKTIVKMLAAVPRAWPTGLFSTDRLGAYLRRNAARAGVSDDF